MSIKSELLKVAAMAAFMSHDPEHAPIVKRKRKVIFHKQNPVGEKVLDKKRKKKRRASNASRKINQKFAKR